MCRDSLIASLFQQLKQRTGQYPINPKYEAELSIKQQAFCLSH